MFLTPYSPASAADLSQEALEAAQLARCRHCDALTPQQVLEVLENLPRRQVLAQTECEVCGREQATLLAPAATAR